MHSGTRHLEGAEQLELILSHTAGGGVGPGCRLQACAPPSPQPALCRCGIPHSLT